MGAGKGGELQEAKGKGLSFNNIRLETVQILRNVAILLCISFDL